MYTVDFSRGIMKCVTIALTANGMCAYVFLF